MNSYNNLARWTLPTTASEKAFYAKHAPTIDRYGFSLKVIQAVWICFSVNPTTKLLWDNLDRLPFLQTLAPILAVALLGFMHYILHHEVIETLSNWQDKDETTVNGFMNWIIPVVLLVGLGLLDVKGVTATLRTDGFEGKKAANSVEAKALLADARLDYDKALTNVASNRREDSTAALAPFQKRMTATNRLPLNDAQDIRAKNKAVQTVNDDWRMKLAEIRQKATDDTRTAETAYNAEKNRINGKSDSTETALTKADADDKASSESHGWWITVFFMLVFLFMSYKYVILRVDSGIRRNMQFTELDAQGGFLEKLSVVIANIWQRQGHRFLTFLHELGSTGASELRDFDGNVILKASNYNGGGNVSGENNQELPPTTPPLSNSGANPTPPPSGGGGNDGGGNNPPQSPTPSPTGGNALAAPIVREADVAVAEIKRQFQRFTTLPENTRVNIALDLSRDFQLPYVDMERILTDIDPECSVVNDTLGFIETEHFGELGMAVGNLKNAQKAAFEVATTDVSAVSTTVTYPFQSVFNDLSDTLKKEFIDTFCLNQKEMNDSEKAKREKLGIKPNDAFVQENTPFFYFNESLLNQSNISYALKTLNPTIHFEEKSEWCFTSPQRTPHIVYFLLYGGKQMHFNELKVHERENVIAHSYRGFKELVCINPEVIDTIVRQMLQTDNPIINNFLVSDDYKLAIKQRLLLFASPTPSVETPKVDVALTAQPEKQNTDEDTTPSLTIFDEQNSVRACLKI